MMFTSVILYLCIGMAMVCTWSCLCGMFTKRTVAERVGHAVALGYHVALIWLLFTL